MTVTLRKESAPGLKQRMMILIGQETRETLALRELDLALITQLTLQTGTTSLLKPPLPVNSMTLHVLRARLSQLEDSCVWNSGTTCSDLMSIV